MKGSLKITFTEAVRDGVKGMECETDCDLEMTKNLDKIVVVHRIMDALGFFPAEKTLLALSLASNIWPDEMVSSAKVDRATIRRAAAAAHTGEEEPK